MQTALAALCMQTNEKRRLYAHKFVECVYLIGCVRLLPSRHVSERTHNSSDHFTPLTSDTEAVRFDVEERAARRGAFVACDLSSRAKSADLKNVGGFASRVERLGSDAVIGRPRPRVELGLDVLPTCSRWGLPPSCD